MVSIHLSVCAYSMHMLKEILKFVFPMSCISCEDNQVDDSLLMCSNCQLLVPKELRLLKPSKLIQKRWALASYDSPVGAALRRAKFGKELVLMHGLADLLLESLNNADLGEMDAVTHIPTSVKREFIRGFDQAEILAQSASEALNIPRLKLLRRLDPSEQSVKSWKQRQETRGRFKALSSPSRVLVVDDVCTSGSTLEAAAQELLLHGAQEVTSLCLLSRQI